MANSKKRVSTPSSTTPGTAFHKDVEQPTPPATEDAPEFDPTRPAKFDIAGFLAGAKKHTNVRTIPVTTMPVEAAELERLTAQADKLARITPEDGEDTPPKRLSAMSAQRKQLQEIQTRMAELEKQLDGTWLLVKVRALKPAEQDAVRNKRVEIGVPLFCAMFEHAGLVAHPDTPDDWSALSADQWADLIEVIGAGQYTMLDQAIDGLTYQAVTPDFYERYSASRATRTTSSS